MANLTETDLLKLISKVDDIHSIVIELRDQNNKEMLTTTETMKLLKVSKSTVERYLRDGILDAIHVGDGKRRLITMSSIKSKMSDGII